MQNNGQKALWDNSFTSLWDIFDFGRGKEREDEDEREDDELEDELLDCLLLNPYNM